MSQKISCVPRFSAVRCQMRGDVLDQGVDLGAGEILGRGGEQPGVERQLAAVGGDGQGVVVAGIDLLVRMRS